MIISVISISNYQKTKNWKRIIKIIFCKQEAFKEMVKNNELLEFAKVFEITTEHQERQ